MYLRRHGRHVRDRDALLLALPGRGEPGELLAVDERHRPRLRVEVVDAGDGRVRVRERQPPVRPVPSRHLADEEIVGIKRDVESVGLVEPHFPAHAPPHCEQQRVGDSATPHLRRRDERDDGIPDNKSSGSASGDHDLQDGNLRRRLRIGEDAVRRA